MLGKVSEKEITISLPETELSRINEMVEASRAESLVEFVQLAVSKTLSNDAAWEQTLLQMLEETGGPATPEEIAWAESMMTSTGDRDSTAA